MFDQEPLHSRERPYMTIPFNLQPAIVAGFFRDLINIGVRFNLAGQNQGQVFLLMGLGVGFKF
jgi:hypothetical protein